MLQGLVAAATLAEEAVVGSFGPYGSGCLVAADRPEADRVSLPIQRAPPVQGGHAAHDRERRLLPDVEATERAVWSTSGRTILRAIRSKCADPIATLILRAALEHNAAAGDALNEVKQLLAGLSPPEERAACTRLAMQFRHIGSVDLPATEGKLTALWPEFGRLPLDDDSTSGIVLRCKGDAAGVAVTLLDSEDDTESSISCGDDDDLLERAEDLARAVVSTALGGRCPSTNASEVLEDLLIDAVFTGSTTLEAVRGRAASLSANGGRATVMVDSGRACVEDSRCLPGVIFTRQVYLSASASSVQGQDGPTTCRSAQMNAIFLQDDFANIMPTSAGPVTVRGGHQGAASVARHREAWIQKVLRWFRTSGVGLLVCSEVLDDTTRHECSHFGIAVCHAVPRSELRWGCSVFGVIPLKEITSTDLLEPRLPLHSIAELASCRRLTVGERSCAWLVPAAAAPNKVHACGKSLKGRAALARTITVAAADCAVGEELARSLRDAIKVLSSWLGARTTQSTWNRHKTAHLVPGGGAFETALSCILCPPSLVQGNAELQPEIDEHKVALKVVSRALLRIPAQLYWSAHPHDIRGWNLGALPELIQCHQEKKFPWGVRPSDGSVVNMIPDDDVGSAELLSGKLILAIHCVQLLASLLKIDAVIHTTTLLRPRENEFLEDARTVTDI